MAPFCDQLDSLVFNSLSITLLCIDTSILLPIITKSVFTETWKSRFHGVGQVKVNRTNPKSCCLYGHRSEVSLLGMPIFNDWWMQSSQFSSQNQLGNNFKDEPGR